MLPLCTGSAVNFLLRNVVLSSESAGVGGSSLSLSRTTGFSEGLRTPISASSSECAPGAATMVRRGESEGSSWVRRRNRGKEKK